MILPILGAIATVGFGVASSIQRNNANRRAAQHQNAQQEWQRREQLRIATERHQQNVLNMQQNYLNQIRQREWRYNTDVGNWRLTNQKNLFEEEAKQYAFQANEIDRKSKYNQFVFQHQSNEIKRRSDYNTFLFQDRANFRRDKFQFELGEASRRFGYESQRTDSYIQNVKDKNRIENLNFQSKLQFELAKQNKQLNEIKEDTRIATQTIRNDLIDDVAESTFNKAVGDISVMAAQATVQASKKRDKTKMKRLAAAGSIMVSNASGNTTQALLNMTKRAELEQNREIDTDLTLALAQSQKNKAKAIADRANIIMSKKFEARKYFADPVLAAQKKHFDAVPLPEYIEGGEYGEYIEPPKFLKGVAAPKFITKKSPIKFTREAPKPIRGPSIDEPRYPDAPKLGDPPPEVYVPKGGLQFGDVLRAGIAGFSAFDTYRHSELMRT